MIFIDQMKNFKIYKTPMFLPTLEKDKKRKSLIFLMTPNYNSSKKLLDFPLFVNKLRFSSYFIDKDVSYYIDSKYIKKVENSEEVSENARLLEESTNIKRKGLYCVSENPNLKILNPRIPDNYMTKNGYEDSKTKRVCFAPTIDQCLMGLSQNLKGKELYVYIPDGDYNLYSPTVKEVPDSDITNEIWIKEPVKVKLVSKIKVIKDKGLDGKKYKYGNHEAELYEWDWKEIPLNISENYMYSDTLLQEFGNSVLNTGDKLILFNEDAKNDAQLKKLLYTDRMKTRQEVILLYDQVKKDFPFIKYTYPDIEKYQQKNLFVDLYFYNNLFFENNTWIMNKGLNLYLDFVKRLIHNPKLSSSGYEKKTIFIPVNDWDTSHDASVWNYKKSLNPMSLIYQLMMSGADRKLLDIFGDINIVFTSANNYFKINFKSLSQEKVEFKKIAIKFKMFLIKICKNEEFDQSDIDTTSNNVDSEEVIKAKIVDKIELSKGVDITPQLAEIKEKKKKGDGSKPSTTVQKSKDSKEEKVDSDKVISKGTLNQSNSKTKEYYTDIKKLAQAVDNATSNSKSEDDALDQLDSDEIKKILMDMDSRADDKVDITAGRAARISELDRKLMNSEINGRTVKDILSEENKKETKTTELALSTPNEEWKDLSFVNFDKNYNIDKDIINCFRFFENVSRPISIRNISVTDNSTSEDRLQLYTVEMEDYRGKRFTVKLDIPIMKDNRFLLRGNNKSIQTQFFNMPIIKTDFDTCQIISNYMKIFVRRFGSGSGKSLPATSRFIKAANKYEGNKIKFDFGDNTKVCSKYQLPIDYIDLSGSINKIETSDFIVYFNQDEIRKLYTIEEEKGIPYMYHKKTKEIIYLSSESNYCFIYSLIDRMDSYKDFIDLFYSVSSSSTCSYSKCSIMNSQIPLVIICAYHEGLRQTLDKAGIDYDIRLQLTKDDRKSLYKDWIKFKDGYLIYTSTYESSLLINGLKDCPTELFELADIDNRNMYLEFLDSFGGRIKADGLENFYDCMVDPITAEVLEFYKFPTDYVSILLYANSLLADNKFIKHTDTSSRRLRRYELIAVYTYKTLADAYASYANQLKHSREGAEFLVKQSDVIDKFLLDSISSDDSCINALRDVEATNAITTKGPSGMNSDRAYSLDKRTYDESMLNVLGMSTGFAANIGITRQATIDANIEGERGYVKNINGDTSKMNTGKTLTVTEALTPFGSTRDDPFRTAMTFIQTAKHMVRTEDSDPLLVTNGSDEALPYLTTDKYAFKAKKNGKIEELTEDYIFISYDDGTKDYVDLKETIEKNSDGGYYVPLKLDVIDKLKVGSKIKENQVIAYDKYSFSNSLGESNNIAYNIGKLAKVAVLNSDEGFEDSGVITESMAEKLATRINLKFEAIIDKESNIFEFAKIGQKVETGDDLVVWQAPFDEEDANSLLKTMASDEVSELGKRKLKSGVTGVVTEVKIFRTIDIEDMSESMQKIVKAYEKPLKDLGKKIKENNLDISQVPAHYKLPPTGKLKKAQDAILVEFYVEYKDTVGIGDKVVYYSANKAVEKSVIPKGKEPYTSFRPNEHIDAFVSEISIDKRMVSSTVVYGSLQKLMIELDRSVKDIMGIPYDDSQV